MNMQKILKTNDVEIPCIYNLIGIDVDHVSTILQRCTRYLHF